MKKTTQAETPSTNTPRKLEYICVEVEDEVRNGIQSGMPTITRCTFPIDNVMSLMGIQTWIEEVLDEPLTVENSAGVHVELAYTDGSTEELAAWGIL